MIAPSNDPHPGRAPRHARYRSLRAASRDTGLAADLGRLARLGVLDTAEVDGKPAIAETDVRRLRAMNLGTVAGIVRGARAMDAAARHADAAALELRACILRTDPEDRRHAVAGEASALDVIDIAARPLEATIRHPDRVLSAIARRMAAIERICSREP